MKTIICLLVAASTITWAQSQTDVTGHDWKATIKVVDETGQPVVGAEVRAHYMLSEVIVGLTDSRGVFVASHHDRSVDLAFEAKKADFYPFWLRYHMGFFYNVDKWNHTRTILLNRIVKPIPMYAKGIFTPAPADGKPLGYDLTMGDWVPPYGKGARTDIIFEHDADVKGGQDYDYRLTVSFPSPGDGIQAVRVPFKSGEGSALRSLHEAPADGYEKKVTKTNTSHPGQLAVFDNDPNLVYYLRVRTILDESGNVKSALYGKIYGDFMQFDYYVNPTPNDRNVEFNPKQNLLKGLKRLEPVKDP